MIVSNITIPYILDKRELSRTKYCFRDSFLYVWIVKFELVVLLVVTVRTRTDREREREEEREERKKERKTEIITPRRLRREWYVVLFENMRTFNLNTCYQKPFLKLLIYIQPHNI